MRERSWEDGCMDSHVVPAHVTTARDRVDRVECREISLYVLPLGFRVANRPTKQ
jgi:hypothetical protein